MKHRFRFVFFLLVLALLSLVVFAYLKRNTTPLLHVDTANNFRSIVISLNAYVCTHKRLPQHTYYDEKTGKPLYSWRYRIIPYIGSYGRDVFYELPWDHSKNSIWLQVPHPYANSGFKEGVWQSASESIPNKTNVFAITGPDTGFGDEPVEFAKLPKDLILFMEIADSGKHWMEPGDFDIRTLAAKIKRTKSQSVFGNHKKGFHVIFADMEVCYLSNNIPFKILAKLLTVTEANRNSRRNILKPYMLHRYPFD